MRGLASHGNWPPCPHIGIVLGTRPEVIKLYPVWRALQPHVRAGRLRLSLLSTGQQRQLLDQTLAWFGIKPDVDLDAMNRDNPGEHPALLHARMMSAITAWLVADKIDRVVVQGDTSSAHAAALAGHYSGLPVSHVEAGLRTWDMQQPFPEEMHRRAIALCADQHFCPTPQALRNLEHSHIDTANAWVVGNTVVDAVKLCHDRITPPANLPPAPAKRLYVTVHRRENHARLTAEILPALRRVVADNKDVDAVVSVHPNPAVHSAVHKVLGDAERVWLLAPLDYGESLAMVRDATIVVTDSGGLQEEATALGTALVVLRQRTERQEAVDAGHAVLPQAGAVTIARALDRLLSDEGARAQMARPGDVFGDGQAAQRIVHHLLMAVGGNVAEGAA